MRLRLVVTSRAERQIREAALWWQQNRPAARGLLRQEPSRTFELITTHPQIGPVADDAEAADVRGLHLGRIRYTLYYRAFDGDRAEVLAFWHMSRGIAPPLSSD